MARGALITCSSDSPPSPLTAVGSLTHVELGQALAGFHLRLTTGEVLLACAALDADRDGLIRAEDVQVDVGVAIAQGVEALQKLGMVQAAEGAAAAGAGAAGGTGTTGVEHVWRRLVGHMKEHAISVKVSKCGLCCFRSRRRRRPKRGEQGAPPLPYRTPAQPPSRPLLLPQGHLPRVR